MKTQSSLYTWLVSRVLFPLHEMLKKHTTVKIKQEMEMTQWLSVAQMKEFQLRRLRELLINVDNDVPYYHSLFENIAFNSSEIQSLDCLQKLPFLSKNIIRKNVQALKSSQSSSLSKCNTGGSSGEPLVFYIANERVSHDVAAKWRATLWWDVNIGDKEIVIWGSPIELDSQDYVRIVRDKLFRTQLLSAFELNDKKIKGYLETIIRIKPHMIFAYPSVINLLAKYAKENNIILSNLGIKVIFVTSEKLYDYQKEQIEAIFQCPVANEYGGRDAGFIARQCPHGQMHITAEDIIVEIIDGEGNIMPPEQSGEIVITNLASKDFPFIRYRTGDIGVLSEKPCSCGRGLPVLKEIQGRSTDFIYATNGTAMYGGALTYIIRELEGIDAFKIIQTEKNKLSVLLVINDLFNSANEAKIVDQFKKRLGDDMIIDIDFPEKIGAEKSGKYRYIVNLMVEA